MRQALSVKPASDPEDPQLVALVSESDEYLQSLYPPESNFAEPLEALFDSDVSLFVGYAGDELAACGALRFVTGDTPYAEVKRLFVAEGFRGQGFAMAMMRHLEDHARESGVDIVRLEAGVRQPEALKLYRKLGYVVRGPFGKYTADPLCVFMEKDLSGAGER